jgi:hypothetical protein
VQDPTNDAETWLISENPLLLSIIGDCAHHKPVKLVILKENVMLLKCLE